MLWINGTPSKEGFYWCKVHDQGGYPFIVAAKLYLDLTEADQKSLDVSKYEKGFLKAALERRIIYVEYVYPYTTGKFTLNSWWNCDAYSIIEVPIMDN